MSGWARFASRSLADQLLVGSHRTAHIRNLDPGDPDSRLCVYSCVRSPCSWTTLQVADPSLFNSVR